MEVGFITNEIIGAVKYILSSSKKKKNFQFLNTLHAIQWPDASTFIILYL